LLRRRSFAITDIGRKRKQNEDSFLADDTLGFYAVADGVGGQAKGEVASAQSVELARNFICGAYSKIDRYLRSPPESAQARDDERLSLRRLLESAVQSACYVVYGMGQQDPQGLGMSTTLSAIQLVGGFAMVAQVGDSRVYHHRKGSVVQVTADHTLVQHQVKKGLVTPEEARTMKGHNVITRAVGHRDYVEVDTFEVDLLAGDRFLVCSDGLHGYTQESEIEKLLADSSIERVARNAVALANERGGKDNVTVLVVEVL
jgi:protein phosphatase